MRPPMKQEVKVYLPREGFKDEYSRPELYVVMSKARVQYSTRTVKAADGQAYETSLEVDLPADVPVSKGAEIAYTDFNGVVTKGKVIAMNEATNLAGNKVFYRTVYVG